MTSYPALENFIGTTFYEDFDEYGSHDDEIVQSIVREYRETFNDNGYLVKVLAEIDQWLIDDAAEDRTARFLRESGCVYDYGRDGIGHGGWLGRLGALLRKHMSAEVADQ